MVYCTEHILLIGRVDVGSIKEKEEDQMEVKKVNGNPQVILTLFWQEALDLGALAVRTNEKAVKGFFSISKRENKEQIVRIDDLLNNISEAFCEKGVE